MKKFNRLFLVLTINIISISLLFLFVIEKKYDFSEEENRYLEKFSIDNIDTYIIDHIPFRLQFIYLKNKFEYLLGKRYINNTYIGKDNYLIPDFQDNKKKKYIIDTINTFNRNNRNVDVMIVPDSILINENKLSFHKSINEEDEIKYLYNKLNTNNINVIDSLKEENKYTQMYYKTDHHWTSFGAYNAYVEYQISKGKDFYSLDQFNVEKVSDDFLGTTYYKVLGIGEKEDIYKISMDNNLTVEYVVENEKTNSLYNDEYLSKKDKYAYFLNNNHALIKIDNKNINNDKSIVIIKNSYANSFVPFIVNHYDKVYVVDLRYYNDSVSDLIKENNINDILILYNLNNLYSDLSIIKLK